MYGFTWYENMLMVCYIISPFQAKAKGLIMELLPNNPVDYLYETYKGDDPMLTLVRCALMLLRVFFDPHQSRLVNRDVKTEKMGMPEFKWIITYDMGLCRRYLDANGNVRKPRFMFHFAELMNGAVWMRREATIRCEWTTCGIGYSPSWDERASVPLTPLSWSLPTVINDVGPWDRWLLKSLLGPGRYVLDSCHNNVFRCRLYLMILSQIDCSDYFSLRVMMNRICHDVKR